MTLSKLLLSKVREPVLDEGLDAIFQSSAPGPSSVTAKPPPPPAPKRLSPAEKEKHSSSSSKKRKASDEDVAAPLVQVQKDKKSRVVEHPDVGRTANFKEQTLKRLYVSDKSSEDEDGKGTTARRKKSKGKGKDANREAEIGSAYSSDHEKIMPVHESLSKKSKKKDTSERKCRYTPEDETSEQRDSRSVFIGNVPAQVAKRRPLLKQLRRHILSHVPDARIETIRLRSIAFNAPTSRIDLDEKEDKATSSTKHNHAQQRAEEWKKRSHSSHGKDDDAEDVAKDAKVYLRPKEKRRIAFIHGEIHDNAASVHAYAVFAHPLPVSLRPPNVPPPRAMMDPYEAARVAVEKIDGTTFLDHMLRVDFVGHRGAGTSTSKEAPGLHKTTGTLADPKLSVFVGNLDFASGEDDLRLFFEGLISSERGAPQNSDEDDGEADGAKAPVEKTWVTRVRIVRDRDTQVGKGFAYVQFSDRECVDEILAMEQAKLKFAKRKLRLQRCKSVPQTPNTKSRTKDEHDPRERDKVVKRKDNARASLLVSSSQSKPKQKSSTARLMATLSAPRGDPALGERLAGLSRDERKQVKASDAERVARRLAKKKARVAMEKSATRSGGGNRMRLRERKKATGPGVNKGRRDGKARLRSDNAVSKKNVKK